MEESMARNCVFCNSPATSKEHIWPNWAARHISPSAPVDHFLNTVEDGQPDKDRTWPQKQFTMTVRAVCESCNNGWMGDLEGRTKPFFEAALDGKGSVLNADLQKDLAAWALKTLMMVESQQSPDASVIPPAEYAHLYASGEPSTGVRVWMATYTGAVSTAVGHIYAGDVTVPEDNPREGTLWGGTILFGPVLFNLLGSDLADLLASAVMDAPGVHQLWPYEEIFTWEPQPGFNDAALPGFMDWFLGDVAQQARRARKLP